MAIIWTERQPAGAANKNWYKGTSSSDGLNLAVVANGGELYTSVDGGISWTIKTPGAGRAVDKNWLYGLAGSVDGTKLLSASNGGRVYTSVNGGNTWTERTPLGASDQSWWASASSGDGNVLLVSTDVTNNGKVYISTNGGASWLDRTPASGISDWQALAANSDGTKLIVGATSGRLYTSIDSGSSWTERQPAGAANYPWKSAWLNSDGTVMYVCGNNRVYKSINSGVTWSDVHPESIADFSSIGVSSDSSKLIVVSAKVHSSLNGGSSWLEEQPSGAFDRSWQLAVMSLNGERMMVGYVNGRLYTGTQPPSFIYTQIERTTRGINRGIFNGGSF